MKKALLIPAIIITFFVSCKKDSQNVEIPNLTQKVTAIVTNVTPTKLDSSNNLLKDTISFSYSDIANKIGISGLDSTCLLSGQYFDVNNINQNVFQAPKAFRLYLYFPDTTFLNPILQFNQTTKAYDTIYQVFSKIYNSTGTPSTLINYWRKYDIGGAALANMLLNKNYGGNPNDVRSYTGQLQINVTQIKKINGYKFLTGTFSGYDKYYLTSTYNNIPITTFEYWSFTGSFENLKWHM